MPRSILLTFSWLAMGFAACAQAGTFIGTVREVVSGDRLRVIDGKGRAREVRFHALAAPVKGQPHYDASRKVVSDLALKKKIWVDFFDHEDGADIGKVFLAGEDLAVKLLKRGAVWYDRRQASDQSVADRGLYTETMEDARRRHLGLWKDRNAVEPWRWAKAADRALSQVTKKAAKKQHKPKHRRRRKKGR